MSSKISLPEIRAAAFSAAVFGLLLPGAILAYYNPGNPTGSVNDFAGMMTADERTMLETKLAAFERASSNEISVVTIPSLEGDAIENFAVKLFGEWKIGKAKNDNGILILIARDDREMRIEVGYGLEGALTDAQSFWIIQNVMRPAFQSGDYYNGISNAVEKIIAATKGEYVLETTERSDTVSNALENFEAFGIGGFMILMWLSSIFARSKSWWAGGAVGGAIGIILGVVFGFFFAGLIAIAALVPLGLLFDYVVSQGYERGKARGHIPWWAGGRSGLGGGRGFGGFGGGSSGGGGASGKW